MRDDYDLINSPLEQSYTADGHTVDVCIYRMPDTGWTLEVVDAHGNSTVWDGEFVNDQEAFDHFLQEIERDGIAALVGPPAGTSPVDSSAESMAARFALDAVTAPANRDSKRAPTEAPIDGLAMAPLSDEEFDELDQFLTYEVDTDEVMMIDIMDGFMHAIAIGPSSLHPRQWLPRIWGTTEMMPPMASIEALNHILALVMRHFNGIIAGLEADSPEILPVWATRIHQDEEHEDAEGWAYGFVTGMKLCWNDWQPLLQTPEGAAWYRPIALLGEEDYCPEQDALTRMPDQRAELAEQIPEAVLAMHAFWLPHRHAVYERELAKTMQPKVGRNELCPCGSGKKFKKCCGAAANLH